MRARARSLATAEISVGRRCATFARGHQISVDADTHGATRICPFQPGIAEDPVEAFLLGLLFHRGRARRYETGHLADTPGKNRCGGPQILDTSIRAGSDEDAVDGD